MSNNGRIKLDAELRQIAGDNVYFQPPASIQIQYPAIIYKRRPTKHTHADNINYLSHHKYEVVVVDRNPDSELVEQMNNFKTIEEVSNYAKDGLNYTVFELYYN